MRLAGGLQESYQLLAVPSFVCVLRALTFDGLFAPSRCDTLLLARRLLVVLVDADRSNVLVEVQVAFQVQESDVTF